MNVQMMPWITPAIMCKAGFSTQILTGFAHAGGGGAHGDPRLRRRVRINRIDHGRELTAQLDSATYDGTSS